MEITTKVILEESENASFDGKMEAFVAQMSGIEESLDDESKSVANAVKVNLKISRDILEWFNFTPEMRKTEEWNKTLKPFLNSFVDKNPAPLMGLIHKTSMHFTRGSKRCKNWEKCFLLMALARAICSDKMERTRESLFRDFEQFISKNKSKGHWSVQCTGVHSLLQIVEKCKDQSLIDRAMGSLTVVKGPKSKKKGKGKGTVIGISGFFSRAQSALKCGANAWRIEAAAVECALCLTQNANDGIREFAEGFIVQRQLKARDIRVRQFLDNSTQSSVFLAIRRKLQLQSDVSGSGSGSDFSLSAAENIKEKLNESLSQRARKEEKSMGRLLEFEKRHLVKIEKILAENEWQSKMDDLLSDAKTRALILENVEWAIVEMGKSKAKAKANDLRLLRSLKRHIGGVESNTDELLLDSGSELEELHESLKVYCEDQRLSVERQQSQMRKMVSTVEEMRLEMKEEFSQIKKGQTEIKSYISDLTQQLRGPVMSTESRLRSIYESEIVESGLSEALMCYVSMEATLRRIEDNDTSDSMPKRMDLLKSVLSHLQENSTVIPSVLMVYGPTGAGKTLFSYFLAKHLLMSEEVIPIHLPLSKTIGRGNLIELRLKLMGFSDERIAEMKKSEQSRIVVIVDGLDEMDSSGESKRFSMKNRVITSWEKAKFVVLCRDDHFNDGRDKLEECLGCDSFMELYVSPFSATQMQEFIHSFVSNSNTAKWSVEEYRLAMERMSGLEEMCQSPFLAALILKSLPKMVEAVVSLELNPHMSKVALYDFFVQQIFVLSLFKFAYFSVQT